MNERVREMARRHGVKLWLIAEAAGLSDSAFSRKLRHELPESEQRELITIIERIAAERGDIDASSDADHRPNGRTSP